MAELVEGERSDVEEVDIIGSDEDSERSDEERSSSSDEEVHSNAFLIMQSCL